MEDYDEVLEELLQDLDSGNVETYEYTMAKRAWELGHTDTPVHLGLKRYL